MRGIIRRPHRRLHRAVVPAVALVVAALAGCAGDDDPGGVPAGEAGPAAADSQEAGDDTVTVTAVDYGFDGLPASAPAGTRLELVNASDEEFHELVVFRLPDDETRPVSELVQLPEEELDHIPDPVTVLLAPPSGGDMVAALGDGTLTEPGRYALVCFIPVGADPAVLQQAIEEDMAGGEGDGPPEGEDGPPPGLGDGPPHAAQGMYAELVIE